MSTELSQQPERECSTEQGKGAHGGDAAVEDKDAVSDGCRAGALLLMAGPEAVQQLSVHVVPVDLHGAIELCA